MLGKGEANWDVMEYEARMLSGGAVSAAARNEAAKRRRMQGVPIPLLRFKPIGEMNSIADLLLNSARLKKVVMSLGPPSDINGAIRCT